MKEITVKIPSIEDCAFKIEAFPEDTPVVGNACAIDDITDKIEETRIIDALEAGNVWAWCIVRVTCIYKDWAITGDSSLGCCSYENEDDFVKGGYFEDLKQDAYNCFVSDVTKLGRGI